MEKEAVTLDIYTRLVVASHKPGEKVVNTSFPTEMDLAISAALYFEKNYESRLAQIETKMKDRAL
jgi:hypothetical protein